MASSSYVEDRIRRLRQRAEEARTMGEALQSPEARLMLIGIAENYERLADYIESLGQPGADIKNTAG